MAQITAEVVRELREKTGAGMMDCKKALEATGGDLEAAEDELRKKGIKKAEKKAGRTTGEGRVASSIASDGRSGAMVAISCETDFVAKTSDFEAFLADVAAHALEHRPAGTEEALAQPLKGADRTLGEALKALVGKLGENIQLADVGFYANPEGRVAAYVHHDHKKGAIVNVSTGADADAAAATLHDLCMHIVSFNPGAISRESIPEALVEREKNIIRDGLEGKPEQIRERIMAGRLEKFFAEQVITEQTWIKDDKTTVEKALVAALGEGTRLTDFKRFEVGAS